MTNPTLAQDTSPTDAIQSSKWFGRVRLMWLVLVGILFVTFLVSILPTYETLKTPCPASATECESWAQLSPESIAKLDSLNISLANFALFNLFIFLAFSLFCWFAGLMVLRYRSHDWYGLTVSYLLITLEQGDHHLLFSSSPQGSVLLDVVLMAIGLTIFPTYLALSFFYQSFPDGKIYPRWARLGTVLILANYAAWLTPAPYGIISWSPLGIGLWLLFVYGFHVFIQGWRYWYYYTKEQRQQTKWLIFGHSVTLVATTSAVFLLGNGVWSDMLEGLITTVGFYLPITAGITIAVLRYRLWDFDIIINRTIVYGLLTVILVGLYALIVSILGVLVQAEGNFIVSMLGAGVIAVIFQPLRHNIQQAINRLMFGQRNKPLTIISELGKSLEAMLSPDSALKHLVETTAQTLKVPYVAIADTKKQNIISFGESASQPVQFPLTYHAQIIGTLLAAPRSPHEALNDADRLILENAAQQASNILHAARLTDDLQASRLQILTTREEERRRLRRDLHDGLGPALATLTLQAEAAKEWLAQNPEKTEMLLGEIIAGTQETLSDIRRIVYELRPPALDELGLVSAIQEQAKRYTGHELAITVTAPESLPPLPAAVEVATYRIVQEALTNVMRHAQARTCQVCLTVAQGVAIEVKDDGVGIPVNRRAGVGLNSMYERASELGGSCVIESMPNFGTQIKVLLPTS